MKKIIILFSIFTSVSIVAGTGHGHGHGHGHSHGGGHSHGNESNVYQAKIDNIKAEKLARNKIRVLAFQDKIVSSWNKAKLDSAVIKEFKGKDEWFLTFSNEQGKKGKKLYVFLKLDGEFVAANFTGK